jgi:hypothetical protein
MLGTVVVHKVTSVKESRARKYYMGLCRASSWLIRWMSPQFPTAAMMYMKKKGREIQMCAASSPGTPFKIKNPGVRLELLAPYMISDKGRTCHTL